MIIKNHLYGQEHWKKECRQLSEDVQDGVKVQFTSHFWESLKGRNLSVGDVYSIFKNQSAEIIQGHARGTYSMNGGKLNQDEVRVFYGITNGGQVIHVVVAIESLTSHKYKFVTVYIPSLVFFERDLKTLKPTWVNKTVKAADL